MRPVVRAASIYLMSKIFYRLLLFSFLGLFLVVGLTEVILVSRKIYSGEYLKHFRSPPLRFIDSKLGLMNIPGVVSQHKATYADETLYTVTCHIDQYGRRENPFYSEKSKNFIFVFGSSSAFGSGVEDNQAWPAVLSKFLEDYNVYNYGITAGGANNIFLIIDEMISKEDFPEKNGLAVYFFNPWHMNRFGDSIFYSRISSRNVRFSLDKQGGLVVLNPDFRKPKLEILA